MSGPFGPTKEAIVYTFVKPTDPRPDAKMLEDKIVSKYKFTLWNLRRYRHYEAAILVDFDDRTIIWWKDDVVLEDGKKYLAIRREGRFVLVCADYQRGKVVSNRRCFADVGTTPNYAQLQRWVKEGWMKQDICTAARIWTELQRVFIDI